MRHIILASILLLVVIPINALGADGWRAHLPPGWLGIVVVHDLPELDRQADRMAKLFGMEAPQLVRLLEAAGLTDVTDVGRTWVVGLAREPNGKRGEYPFAFIPVADFKTFVNEYDGDINGRSAIVTIEGQDLLAVSCGKWSLLMNPDHREVLESIMTRKLGELPEDEKENDTTGIATVTFSRSGLKWLTEYQGSGEQPSREQAVVRRKRGLAMLSPEGIRESLTLDRPLWEWVAATFSVVNMSVAFDETGGAKLEFAIDLSSRDGTLKEHAKAEWGGEQGFPDDRPWITKSYVLPSGALATMATGLQIALLKSTPEDLGINEFAAGELDGFAESLRKAVEQVLVAQVVTLANDKLPVYGNRLILLRVAEGDDFIESCDRLMQDWNALLSASNAEVKVVFAEETVEIAGRKGKRYFVDMVEAVDVPRSREVAKVMEEMFGPDGILNWYVLSQRTPEAYDVTVSNLPRNELRSFFSDGSGGTFHRARPGLSFDFDASAYVDWCRRRDRAIQGEVMGGPRFVPLPKSDPLDASLSISDGRLKAYLVLPIGLLQTLGKYSQELREQ